MSLTLFKTNNLSDSKIITNFAMLLERKATNT